MAEPTKEELLARIAELEKQAGAKKTGKLEFRVGDKGGVSVYGLGRFPITLYYEQTCYPQRVCSYVVKEIMWRLQPNSPISAAADRSNAT
jgi:hypothetical protein